MKRLAGLATLTLLLLACTFAPAWCQMQPQPQQQQPHYIMGIVTQVSQGSLQVQDNMGMTSTITVTPQTAVFSYAKDPRAAQCPFSEIRQGDKAIAATVPQGGGVFAASAVGILHAGETPNPAWTQGSGAGPQQGSSPATGQQGSYPSGGSCPPATGQGAQPGYNNPSAGSTYPGAGYNTAGSTAPTTGGTAVTDPNGHFSLSLPAGWVKSGSQQGIDMYGKQGSQGVAGFYAGSMPVPPQYQQTDVLSIAQNVAQNCAAQGQQYNYQLIGVTPFNIGGLSGAVHKYTYKAPNGMIDLVEDYFFKLPQFGVQLHFESTQEAFEAFRPDFQQVLQSLRIQ